MEIELIQKKKKKKNLITKRKIQNGKLRLLG